MNAVSAGAQPKRMGSFEILHEIGQGGMGVVYLARQPALERLVVLKKIRRELLADASMLERFQREARSAAAVHHHNVVGVYDCFEARGDQYIAQEFVEGPDLRSILEKLGRLDPEIAALIALEVARGLEEIHALGIVHRDLKPANILIGSTGETKIADFGIAVEAAADGLTRPGAFVGSIPYMAPEQLLGQRADHRADIFLFGNLLYEMLTGAPPYRAASDEGLETLLERMQGERYVATRRVVPATPRELARLIRRCLRARPARRPASATALRLSLERVLGRPSTHECRKEIARCLWEREIFRPAEGKTAMRKTPARRGTMILRERLRWAGWTAACSILVFAGVAGYALLSERGEPPVATRVAAAPVRLRPAEPAPPPIVAPPPEPARVRIVAQPWANIEIDGAPGFCTPRAAPVELAPGRHRIVFAHPKFGRFETVLELQPGEARTVRHDFAVEAAR